MPRLFCFGLGYTAHALGNLLAPWGWSVSGTARVRADATLLRFDRDHPLAPGALAGVTHILSSVPPDEQGDPVLGGAGEAIVVARESLDWVGYLSTTGVYGDTGGTWVDEASPPAPTSERARRRVTAEAGWLALSREHGYGVFEGPAAALLEAQSAAEA